MTKLPEAIYETLKRLTKDYNVNLEEAEELYISGGWSFPKLLENIGAAQGQGLTLKEYHDKTYGPIVDIPITKEKPTDEEIKVITYNGEFENPKPKPRKPRKAK